jgi:hypothetical protein
MSQFPHTLNVDVVTPLLFSVFVISLLFSPVLQANIKANKEMNNTILIRSIINYFLFQMTIQKKMEINSSFFLLNHYFLTVLTEAGTTIIVDSPAFAFV